MLSAAEKRQDEVVKMRMLAHSDLFAFDAKYHRSCYSHYISDRNISAARQRIQNEKQQSSYDESFLHVVELIEQTVLSEEMTVTNLSSLCDQFVKSSERMMVDSADSYTSWKVKERLIKHFGDRIVFIKQPGRSDIVCSSKLTVGDAFSISV